MPNQARGRAPTCLYCGGVTARGPLGLPRDACWPCTQALRFAAFIRDVQREIAMVPAEDHLKVLYRAKRRLAGMQADVSLTARADALHWIETSIRALRRPA
jgi:hypothetical protein